MQAIDRALQAARESKRVEFKEKLDVFSAGEWCELIKDIAAMANSGGGIIVVGLKNDGSPSRADVRALLDYDSAKIVDKIASYTGRQFDEFDVVERLKGGCRVAVMTVGEVDIPMVFEKPGTYQIDDKKQATAFPRGSIVFRHGAKSEPARYEDLVAAFERVVNKRRRLWIKGIRQVVESEPGDTVQVVRGPAAGSEPALRGRIALDGDARAVPVRPTEADSTWPHRQKDVLQRVNAALSGEYKLTSHDIFSVKKQFDIDTKHPEFFYRPFIRSSPQYSDAFIDWLVKQFRRDPSFFRKARQFVEANVKSSK